MNDAAVFGTTTRVSGRLRANSEMPVPYPPDDQEIDARK
jgi:hypothetical protein